MSQGILIIQKYIRGRMTRIRMARKIKGLKEGYATIFRIMDPKFDSHKQHVFKLFFQCNIQWIEKERLRKEREKLEYIEAMRKSRGQKLFQSDADVLDTTLLPRMLPSAITIQKTYRKYNKKKFHPQKVFNVEFGTIERKCQLCNEKNIDNICRYAWV